MVSTPAPEIAQEILQRCLEDGTWSSRSLDALLERCLDSNPRVEASATRALFSILVEGLADRFEPELCDAYADLFTYVIARVLPAYKAEDLRLRYRRMRQMRRFWGGEVRRVYVLSRVTLGADVAVTSVVLTAMKERFPDAEILLVGPSKNAELFADDVRVQPAPFDYSRSGSLRDRLLGAPALQTLVDEPGAVVIDPDSRLTQLGLLPICDDARYFFFESRAAGGSTETGLPSLTSEWLEGVFGTAPAVPYVAPARQERRADICVSWGVGENQDKRISDAFEFEVVEALLRTGHSVMIDRGAGGEEAERVEKLSRMADSPLLQMHEGTYASFASHIAQSKLYVGYDSAGQHVAAAAGVPLVSVFAGYPCERMMQRWRPTGAFAQVIPAENKDPESVLKLTLEAILAAL